MAEQPIKDEPAAPSTSSNGDLPTLAAAAEPKRRRTDESPEDPRRMFQRLWTDDDEIAILQGFLAFTAARRRDGGASGGAAQHDTALFYDQIRDSLRLDVNKSQLVEKLRRLKKKYRNAAARLRAGKDHAFKTPHDQAAFHLSAKIWGAAASAADDDDDDDDVDRRSKPIPAASPGGYLSPMPISSLAIGALPFGLGGGAAVEAKWRRQQILELEVLSQRIDLMQEQIKLQLADLRSRR
ncbi:uncharacterized protein LOC144714176 [Wolffia australiana]